MKTKVIATVSAILAALGGLAAAKWAVPPESLNEIVGGVVAIISGAFGIYAAKHVPQETK